MAYPTIVSTAGTIVGYTSGTEKFATPAGGQAGDYVIATIDILDPVTLTAPAPWVTIGAATKTGTLDTFAFAAPWSAGLSYSYTNTNATSARPAVCTSILVRGADVIANWILGPITTRAALGTSTTTVAPSMTATVNETLVVGLFGERTTAVESAVSSVTNATHVAFYNQPSGATPIESSEIVSKTLAVAGNSTGTITVTYPNVQAVNGVCQLIGIPPAPPPTIHGPLYSTSAGPDREITLWTGTQEVIAGLGTPGYRNVATMLATSGFNIAHRGGDQWVEHTMRAYTNSVFWSCGALEVSTWKCSTGEWVCSHNKSTLAVFGTDLDITLNTWTTLSALRTTVGSYPMLLLSDLLAAYASTHVFLVDNKENADVTGFLDMLDAAGGPTRFISKSFYTSATLPNAARARGYETWGYYFEADAPNVATTHTPHSILGMTCTASTTAWTQVLAPGKPVIAHTVNTASDRTTAINNGASGIMAYSITNVVPRTFPASISLL